MDFNPTPFDVAGGLISWLQLVGVLTVIALALGLLGSFLSGGVHGFSVFTQGLGSFLKELASLSPRRVMALASLTIKESVRRKALLVFVVFAILLMFGGWFLTDSNDRADLQFSVHITFMLTIISWLILPVAIFLSCWGIPEDIRIRSLHTVVTKPARRVEVVLGRMLGFSAMAMSILVLMGVVGYVWIQRQVPAEIQSANAETKSLLTCRVPVYGAMFFLDRDGLPKTTGLNVGDPWMYRSFVEGNSRSRAVWLFNNITPSSIGDTLRIESRFEAFRTVKGSEDSINRGLEAQYTLVNNTREDAFSSFGVGAGFRETAEALRDGNFENASQLLASAAERMLTTPGDFPVVDCQQVSIACERQVVPTLRKLGDSFTDVANAFEAFGKAAAAVQVPTDEGAYRNLSTACATLSDVLQQESSDLLENMPRIEVPLPPFRVTEFHEGDDFHQYSRELTYAGDYEAVARFLSKTISAWNEQGKVVSGDELSASLVDDLANDAGVAEVNAELVQQVLQEEIESGKLTITDGKLAVADGSRWLTYFDSLVRQERLISQDPAGWVLKADLFEDLAPDGFLRIEVACLDDQMYLGMARPDMFIRLKDNAFITGYSKALLNIGLMLSLVIVLGVTASCVVKGPVSFFFTLTVFVIGQFFHEFMLRLLSGTEKGAGMVESAVMIFQHRNPSVGADVSESNRQVMQVVDNSLLNVLNAASNIIPDFSTFSGAASYIENGFDVPWSSSVLPAIATFVGFLIPCVIIGAACLKFRELEAK